MENINTLDFNVSGQYVNINVEKLQLNNSLSFSLLIETPKENIKNEISRIKNDILNCKAVSLLLKSFDKTIKIIRSSKEADEAARNLVSEFNISEREASFALNLPLTIFAGYNFEKLEENLKTFLQFFESFLSQNE